MKKKHTAQILSRHKKKHSDEQSYSNDIIETIDIAILAKGKEEKKQKINPIDT